MQGRFVLTEGGAEPRPEEEQTAAGSSEGVDAIQLFGVTAFYDWNVLLDQQGGPNHVGNYCLAPFLFDTQSHELQPQLIQSYIAHFCHYLKPGAVRIGFSRFTSDLDTTAYQNPDGRIVVVMMNRSSSAMPVCLRLDERICRLELPANSISTAVVDGMIEA